MQRDDLVKLDKRLDDFKQHVKERSFAVHAMINKAVIEYNADENGYHFVFGPDQVFYHDRLNTETNLGKLTEYVRAVFGKAAYVKVDLAE